MPYKIAWKNEITGKTGKGKPIFKKEKEAFKEVYKLNKKHPAITHWVEEEK